MKGYDRSESKKVSLGISSLAVSPNHFQPGTVIGGKATI
jgi:hypothetical protein